MGVFEPMRKELVTRKEVKEDYKKLGFKVPKEYSLEDLKVKAKILLNKWDNEFDFKKNKIPLNIIGEISYRFIDLEQDYKSILSLNELVANRYDYFVKRLPKSNQIEYLIRLEKDEKKREKLKEFLKICKVFEEDDIKVNNLDEHLNNKIVNSGEYWDEVYKNEINNFNFWRKYPETVKRVSDLISNKDIKSVLELGCGYSSIHTFFNGKYLGLDISKTIIKYMIDEYKTKGNRFGFENHNFKYCDVLNGLTHECAEYDVVIATEFLEHFKDDELDKIFTNLKPFKFKKSIFVVPDDVLGNEDCIEHHQKWNKETFKIFLEKYYKDVKVCEYVDNFDKIAIPCLLAECGGLK
jgi:SAM-dependent methyltransferase